MASEFLSPDDTQAMAQEAAHASTPAPSTSFHTVAVTAENFIAEVIDASNAQLVLVDFWAPWSEPCKKLTPILEKIAANEKGTLRLAMINIDENPALAQQLKVQSVPSVFAFKNGRPVDAFVGSLAESQLRQFIEKNLGQNLSPTTEQILLETAQEGLARAESSQDAQNISAEAREAAHIFSSVLAQDSTNCHARAGFARCQLLLKDPAAAQQTLNMTPPDQNNHPAILAARAKLDFVQKSSEMTIDFDAIKARLKKDETDHEARFQLAMGLYNAAQPEAAIDALMEIVARKRDWNEAAAHKQLVAFFDLLGPEHEITRKGRKRLSSILFA